MTATVDTSTAAQSETIFSVERGRLVANADMYWEYIEDFDKATAKLMDSRKSKVEIDLTRVNFISSSYLGCLSSMVVEAARRKKRIDLKINQDVAWLFDIMGGQKNVCMEIY